MPLADIIDKERIIHTPYAQDLAESPKDWENRFRFHVSTYVVLEEIEGKWDAILDNLCNKRRSATGLIYADTGYGKTATGASLWEYAEAKGLVAVPPFRWDSLADMLTATHGWICYRLAHARPDLIPNLERKHQEVVAIDEETLAERRSREDGLSLQQARRFIAGLRAEGRLLDALSSRQLFDYLQFATRQVLESGYKGLLILPDEFELFKNNPDTAENYQQLKGFIFDVHEEKNLPIGCVVLTYNETIADIRLREEHILPRFNEPEGSHIDLEQFYGRTEFARKLWEKLAISCNLSNSEKTAIADDVLDALGQFLRHQRSTELISGPRSVVATFRRAALHYTEQKNSYSLREFCEDYLSGNISFSSQEIETARAHTQIMALPIINNAASRNLVKLLCVHPEGVPGEIFQKHGILNPESIIETLLPEHVVTTTIGPTLKHYAADGGVPPLTEILKTLKTQFRPENRDFHRIAVRAFKKYVLPIIFTMERQERRGWSSLREITGNGDRYLRSEFKGTTLREYPDRTLTIDISTEAGLTLSSASHFRVWFILNPDSNATNTCQINSNGLVFQFNILNPIDAHRIPEDVSYLGELFMPASITPLLLLSILDFFDRESIISIVERERLGPGVDSLKSQILNELIGYFFSHEVKEDTVIESSELLENFASVPAGRNFVESLLRILIPKQFPEYSAVAVSNGWQRYLGTYKDALSRITTLGRKQGIDPIKTLSRSVPDLFNMGQMTAFQNFYNGAGQKLLRIDEIDDSGNTLVEKVEPRNNNKQVGVYFTPHPLEKHLVQQLQNSSETITIDALKVNALDLPTMYQQASEIGYLDEEVDMLLAILKARGIADQRQVRGAEYLYLVETSINFADLKNKLKRIEDNVTLAEANGFVYQCNDLPSARMLTSTIGIENDEVQKDELRQNLNSVETNLNNKCAEWLKTEHENLRQKINALETLHLQVPPVLEQQTGHPTTEFSTILFHSVQPKAKSAYTKISDKIRKIQAQVKETCDHEVQMYESGKTPRVAIEIASRLQKAAVRFDTQIEKLNQQRVDAQELYHLFRHWRVLASETENNKQLMVDSQTDSAVMNLIERLNTAQRDIRQHLADNGLTLKDVLGSHEHFKKQIDEINSEFTQILTGKKDRFIDYQSQIAKHLRRLPSESPQLVEFNPLGSEGCYRKVRENAVGKLRSVIKDVLSENKDRQRELLKPIKVFNVPEELRTKAIQLRKNLEELAEECQRISLEFAVEAVDQDLSEWVDQIISTLQEGQVLSETRRQIERELDALVPEPSPRAQRLRNELAAQQETDFTELIVHLLGNETFNSTVDILESLEELYQANLVNLTVHRK